MSWSATHGNGAVIEAGSGFQKNPSNGYCLVKATSGLTGNVHFCVPRLPAGSSSITGVRVEFTAQNATVDTLTIWLGNRSTPAGSNLDWRATNSESLTNALSVANTPSGIDITIGVSFDNTSTASYIRFQSVGLSYS